MDFKVKLKDLAGFILLSNGQSLYPDNPPIPEEHREKRKETIFAS